MNIDVSSIYDNEESKEFKALKNQLSIFEECSNMKINKFEENNKIENIKTLNDMQIFIKNFNEFSVGFKKDIQSRKSKNTDTDSPIYEFTNRKIEYDEKEIDELTKKIDELTKKIKDLTEKYPEFDKKLSTSVDIEYIKEKYSRKIDTIYKEKDIYINDMKKYEGNKRITKAFNDSISEYYTEGRSYENLLYEIIFKPDEYKNNPEKYKISGAFILDDNIINIIDALSCIYTNVYTALNHKYEYIRFKTTQEYKNKDSELFKYIEKYLKKEIPLDFEDSRTYFDDFKEDKSEKSAIDNNLKTEIIKYFENSKEAIENVDEIIEAIKKCNSETSLIELFKSFKNDKGIGNIFIEVINSNKQIPPPLPPPIPIPPPPGSPLGTPFNTATKLKIEFKMPDTTGDSGTPEKPDPRKFSSWEEAYKKCDGKTIYACDCDTKIYITKEEWKPKTGGFGRFKGGTRDISKIILIFFISATIILIIVIIICICCNINKNKRLFNNI